MRTIIISLIAVSSFLITCEARAYALDLPRDGDGWTIFTPSSDTRIIYVDPSTGDDATCQASPETCRYGSEYNSQANYFEPVGENAYATYAAAFSDTRDNYPDWILVKRGENLYESVYSKFNNGRSATEPFLLASYGTSGPNPVFNTPRGESAFRRSNRGKEWVAFSGVSFYAYTRDPDNPSYVDNEAASGISITIGNYDLRGLLFEGCVFSFYSNSDIQHLNDTGGVDRVELYRTVIKNNWNDGAHSQGLYIHRSTVHIDECVFDHNGWYSQAGSGQVGEATVFNHNLYLSTPKDVVIKNSVFLRSSSIQNKSASYEGDDDQVTGPTITNNLYVDGEIGLSLWASADEIVTYQDLRAEDNVFTRLNRSAPTNRNLALAIDIADANNAVVRNNIILKSDLNNNSSYAVINLRRVDNTNISNNIAYDTGYMVGLRLNNAQNGDVSSGNSYTNNVIYSPANAHYLQSHLYDSSTGWTFSGNQYFSNKVDGERFYANESMQIDEWWTNNIETFRWGEPSFPDPNRSVETYMDFIGEPASIDAFIAAANSQDRYNWDSRYASANVNDYIREGFDLEGEPAPVIRADVNQDSSVNSSDALLVLRRALNRSMSGTDWRSSATTGDVNCDGSVTVVDALLLLREHLGLDNSSSGWCG